MLFSNQRKHQISVPATVDGKSANIAFLVDHLCKNLMKDPRQELFVLDGGVYVFSFSSPSHSTTQG